MNLLPETQTTTLTLSGTDQPANILNVLFSGLHFDAQNLSIVFILLLQTQC